MKVVKLTFDNQKIVLDFNEFVNCEFNNCTLEYYGHGDVALQNCKFSECTWALTDAALRTVQYLAALHKHRDESAKRYCEGIVQVIIGER